jgi:hypothetical protein
MTACATNAKAKKNGFFQFLHLTRLKFNKMKTVVVDNATLTTPTTPETSILMPVGLQGVQAVLPK